MKSMKNKLFNLFTYSMLDRFLSGTIQVLIFSIVVKYLNTYDIGLFGLFSGLLVFYALITLEPATILIRDYPKLKDKISLELFNFIYFAMVRMIIFIALSFLISFLYTSKIGFMAWLFVIFIVNYSIQTIGRIFHELLYVSFNQKFNFYIYLIISIIELALFYFLLPIFHYLWFYLISMICMNIIYTLILIKIVIKKNRIILKKYHFNIKSFFKNNILNFSLWNHFNGSIEFMIYKIDTFVLSFFVSLENLALYTVALNLSNYFFILPQQIEKTLKIGYSNSNTGSPEEKRIYNAGSILLILISLVQLFLFIIFGKFFIKILFPTMNITEIYSLALLIISGVSILNIIRPILAILIIRENIRLLFFHIYLPAGVISLVIYFILGKYYSLYGVAFGNIIVYSIFSLFVLLYKRKNSRPSSERSFN